VNVQSVAIGKIRPARYNPRKDLKPEDPEYRQLQKAIDHFGLVEPLVWNKQTGNLVGGHQRFKILKARGDKTVAVSVVSLNTREEKALNIALNKHSGEWNPKALGLLLKDLQVSGFDMETVGFDAKELKAFEAPELTPVQLSEQYAIIIECENEKHQTKLLEAFTKKGLKCRALIS